MEQQSNQFNGTIQFYHQCKPTGSKYTVCLLTPSEAALKFAYTNLTTLNTKMGLAKCNPKDQYLKKTGREVSLNNLKDVVLVPASIDFENKKAQMRVKDTQIMIDLVFGNSSGRVYFVGYLDWSNVIY